MMELLLELGNDFKRPKFIRINIIIMTTGINYND